jgi:hypothetical protein
MSAAPASNSAAVDWERLTNVERTCLGVAFARCVRQGEAVVVCRGAARVARRDAPAWRGMPRNQPISCGCALARSQPQKPLSLLSWHLRSTPGPCLSAHNRHTYSPNTTCVPETATAPATLYSAPGLVSNLTNTHLRWHTSADGSLAMRWPDGKPWYTGEPLMDRCARAHGIHCVS